MLIVEVKNGKIERALKTLKKKVRNTKQNQELRTRQEFVKKSTKKRQQRNKAAHKQSLINDD